MPTFLNLNIVIVDFNNVKDKFNRDTFDPSIPHFQRLTLTAYRMLSARRRSRDASIGRAFLLRALQN
jgi:hypothetical protein